VISVVRLAGGDELVDEAAAALAVLAARPGYLRGSAARATDDPRRWVLVTEWRDIGSYRRALGSYDVKIQAQPLLSQALDEVSAYEVLVEAEPGAAPVRHESDAAMPGDLDTLG
jgi:heme oxygenase (mycobilin-producing)